MARCSIPDRDATFLESRQNGHDVTDLIWHRLLVNDFAFDWHPYDRMNIQIMLMALASNQVCGIDGESCETA
jgi:hypothetical protein